MRLLIALAGSLLLAPWCRGAAPPGAAAPQALADRIDRRIEAKLKEAGVVPAPQANDAAFLRRLSLDLTGRIPTPRDVHDFLADRAKDRRRRLIDEMLDSPRHAQHFARVWRALLLPEASANRQARYFQPGFEAWLRDRFRARVGYDRLVRELLAAPIGSAGAPADVFRKLDQPSPLAFFAVKEARPENIAAAATRVFLGVQLECAQCHDHPFAKWTREQFWNQAAFFAGVEREGDGLGAPLIEKSDRRAIQAPYTSRMVPARFLDRKTPPTGPGVHVRVAFAEWLTSRDNSAFAQAAVNRLWGQFFGRGLVDPVDDFNDNNPPSHPELLDELARSFAASGFDLHYLIRGITLSRVYQRGSALTHPSQDDPRLLGRMNVKGLTAEQLFDSLVLAVGYREPPAGGPFEYNPRSSRNQFITLFAGQGRPAEAQTSILQALTLMNGKFIADATRLESSNTLTAVAGNPVMDLGERLEALYLATLSRKPTVREQEKLLRYVRARGKAAEPRRLADVFWVLLNSAEFRLNH